jgi:branched-chain amino acid transport system permease protein
VSVAREEALDRASSKRSLAAVDRGLATRAVAIAAFLLIVMFVLPLAGNAWTKTFTGAAIYAVVAASLGVLYGRVGMISLGQIGILVVATWVASRLAFATSLPFPVLLLVTGLITTVVGVIVGLPALRLSGLYLALITLMFAGAVTVIINKFQFPNGGHGFLGHLTALDVQSIQGVRRPSMAQGDTAYFRYTVIVCALMFFLALAHVATKPGRAWTTIRGSEPAALAAGVNMTLYKMWAFALASFMTGVAGGLYAAQLVQPSAQSFATQDSITLLATALIGGIYSFWGAVVAGVFIQVVPFLFTAQGIFGWRTDANIITILFGVGLLQVLLTAPGGLAEQFPKDMANLGRFFARQVRKAGGGGKAAKGRQA